MFSALLYLFTINEQTELINSVGFDEFLFPERILEMNDASYPIKRESSAMLMFNAEIIAFIFLLKSSKLISISFNELANLLEISFLDSSILLFLLSHQLIDQIVCFLVLVFVLLFCND